MHKTNGHSGFTPRYRHCDLTDLAAAKMTPNFANFQRVGQRQVPHQAHPAFNTNANDAAFVALQALYDKTLANKAAGTCGPSRLP